VVIPARGVTPHGRAIYDEFTDLNGSRVWVQDSSLASDRAVWVFAQRGDMDTDPHLNVEQARRVRDALDAFIRENEDRDGQ
jgi:hypothetical protein